MEDILKKSNCLQARLEQKEHIWKSKYKKIYNKKCFCLDTQNFWRIEKSMSYGKLWNEIQCFVPWKTNEIVEERGKAFLTGETSVGRDKNKGVCVFCILSRSGSVPRTWWASCRGGSLPCSSWSPCTPLIIDRMRERLAYSTCWCWQYFCRVTPRGCLYPYLKLMPCWQNSFSELECRRSHGFHVALPWKSWWETRSGLVTHRSLAQDIWDLVWLL